MFGYIRPYTPELKMKEYDAFRAVYCGLCHQLGKSFGMLARLTLNYDFVFLALLYYGQHEDIPKLEKGRCAVNPFHKVPLCVLDDGMKFTGDIAALMMYYKIKDNIEDSGKISGMGWRFTELIARRQWKKAAKRQPDFDTIIQSMMKEQREMEKRKPSSLDEASEPTARAFLKIAGSFLEEDSESRIKMERLGYLVGRYVYLCDAADDLEDDCKNSSYNPLIYKYLNNDFSKENIIDAKKKAVKALYMTIGEMGQIVKEIDFTCFSPIISNIINFGIKHSLDDMLNKEGNTYDKNPL